MQTTPDFNPYRYQLFKGSSDDITRQTHLWRYMNFEKFCWLIEKSLLHHTRLDQFEDPFEGAVTNEYARRRDAGKIDPAFSDREYEPWIFRSLRVRQFATCWYASEHESDALWKLYAGTAGVAVVSTMARLEESVDIRPHTGMLGQVEYVDFETHGMRRGHLWMRPGHLKRKSFEHEREVRGLLISNPCPEGLFVFDEQSIKEESDKQPRGIDCKADLKALIAKIVISPFAKPYFEELVRIVTARHGLDHLVAKSTLLTTPAY